MLKLPKKFTTVTPLSKMVALVLVIVLPFLGFYAGLYYENLKNGSKEANVEIDGEKLVVTGEVTAGGNAVPKELLDSPREFVYKIKMEGGMVMNVSYTAFPPNPGMVRPAVELSFHDGSINKGDYLEARGTYDASTNTITVKESGDYIKTFER